MPTLMQTARAGRLTETIVAAADHEGLDPGWLRAQVAAGQAVIPANRRKRPKHPRAVGAGTRIKVNANIGASSYHSNPEEEVEKLVAALAHGADAVMDLSLGPHQGRIRRAILAQSTVMVGTVPLYQTVQMLAADRREIFEMTIEDVLGCIRRQAEEGVDFMTIHSGVTRRTQAAMDHHPRRLGVVSRGGAIMVNWLRKNGGESILYTHFDEILDILAAHEVTVSLGDGLRPGTTVDAGDPAQTEELLVLAELTQRAWEKGVQVIVEGPGHVPLDQIPMQMQQQKQLCQGAPFYLLGPLVTDVAAGFDHIAGAVGGAVAALNGADFLCTVTPAEHLRLPTCEDVVEGVMAARIAAHAADLARGLPAAVAREEAMAKARKTLDWERQIALALSPAKAGEYRRQSGIEDAAECTMCGEYCAIKQLGEFGGKR
ncbi:MAG: phosphomethylpyrimidine synthase ThiC [Desulfosarcinaceae bacterium]|jgi:phosphomethylpyrimidine synthase